MATPAVLCKNCSDPGLLVSYTDDSPLHCAVKTDKWDAVEALLKSGENPNLGNRKGLTPLHVIISWGNLDADSMEAFFKLSERVGGTRIEIDARDKLGNSPLHLALLCGNKKAAELLLRRGADPNLTNGERSTPLHLICRDSNLTFYIDGEDQKIEPRSFNDDYDMAKMLFEIGDELGQTVQVNGWDTLGNTPLHRAVERRNRKLVALLMSRGADPRSPNAKRLTPVHLMYKKCDFDDSPRTFFKIDEEAVRQIHDEVRDKKGRTMLQWAVANYLPLAVRAILNEGADLSGFVFPSVEDFDEHIEAYKALKLKNQIYGCKYVAVKIDFRMDLISDVFGVVQQLKNKKYQMVRSDASTIAKFFAKHGVFDVAADLDMTWINDKGNEKQAKELRIIPDMSIYDFMQLPSDEAEKLLTYTYFTMAKKLLGSFSPRDRQMFYKAMASIILGEFVRAWALEDEIHH